MFLNKTIVCRQQEKIAHEREEIERQRKLLSKKKPSPVAGGSKGPKNRDADGFVKPGEQSK